MPIRMRVTTLRARPLCSAVDDAVPAACFAVSGEGHRAYHVGFSAADEAPSRSDGCADAKAVCRRFGRCPARSDSDLSNWAIAAIDDGPASIRAPVTAAVRQQQDMPLIDSRTTGRAILNDPRAAPMADPRTFPAWKQFANGSAQVPGDGSDDTVPSYLTPGEAVLTPGAAQHVGRPKIAALNAMHPPVLSTFMPPVGSRQATTTMRAGARGIKGALSNTKLRPKIAGGLSGA